MAGANVQFTAFQRVERWPGRLVDRGWLTMAQKAGCGLSLAKADRAEPHLSGEGHRDNRKASMSGETFVLGPRPPKLRRVLELVYGVEGVVSARVWQWPGRIAVGVRGGNATSPTDLIRRIEMAVAGLREADERWDFGILEDAAFPAHEARVRDDDASSPRRSPRSPS
jgi:hypothetical protein